MTAGHSQAIDGALPPRAGVGLKPEHYREILETSPDIGWFEVHAEDYMGEGGPPHHFLSAVRERYPVSLHGVGLSIGGYVAFAGAAMSEVEFLREVVRRTGCGLLLDVNNVFVQSVNHGFDAASFIDAFPVEHVGEIHLGGHATDSDEDGSALLIDDHGRQVADDVWALYAHTLSRAGPRPTLIEWDNDVPEWEVLFREAKRADHVIADRRTNRAAM